MEYVEGTPLKRPLPLDQALKYAAQICDALDAAHKKNITHRDLKPANILVTKAGVKLLDFGLAKVGPAVQPPDDATLTMALTGKNEIVGTLLYMSPEQLQSKEADARSDVFSFGLVLYEMLTGRRAFDGGNAASIIAAILERPAPSVASVAPPALDRALQRCLAKDPDDRWQSARDLKAELVWIADGGTEAPRLGSCADSGVQGVVPTIGTRQRRHRQDLRLVEPRQCAARSNREFVARQRSGLVGAEKIHPGRFIERREARRQDTAPRHGPRPDRRRERKHRRERHRNRSKSGNQHQLRDLRRRHGQIHGITGQQDGHAAVEQSQVAHHAKNRLLLGAFDMGGTDEFGAAPEFRARARRDDFGHRRAAPDQRARIGLEASVSLDRHGFAGEHRLVDEDGTVGLRGRFLRAF